MIDISFKMISDSLDKDPDTYSETLNRYHFLLWNKNLPSTKLFSLKRKGRNRFKLLLNVKDISLELSSDSIIHTYSKWDSMNKIIEQVDPDKLKKFKEISSTIGGYIIFPSKKINNKATINASRGLNPYISDRFDLTLECIRRFYLNESSPLFHTLNRYREYFSLFGSFKGFVDFFLLKDLTDNYYNVKFWLPFNNFKDYKPVPKTLEEYQTYLDNVINFIKKRNERIKKYSKKQLK